MSAPIGAALSVKVANHVHDLAMTNRTAGAVHIDIQSGGSVTTVNKK